MQRIFGLAEEVLADLKRSATWKISVKLSLKFSNTRHEYSVKM